MNIAYVTAIISILALLIFAVLSFIKARDMRFQVAYIVVASLNIGVIISMILVNYSSKSALVWPCLLLLHVVNKAAEIAKALKKAGY
jgi:hypothetical protein